MGMLTPEHWETVRTVLVILGGGLTGWATSMIVRKSQKESSQITLLLGLVDQLQEERDSAVRERDQSRTEVRDWRRYTRGLRSQVYALGGEPREPENTLDI